MAEWVIRGVPQALQRDMWWLERQDEVPDAQGAGAGLRGGLQVGRWRLAALAGLVAIADWLFYGHRAGLSLAIFGLAVLLAAMALAPGRDRLRPLGLFILAALPVIDLVQPLSLAFLAAGLCTSLVWATGGREEWTGRLVRLVADLPFRGFLDGMALGRELGTGLALRDHGRTLRAWAFPAGGALVLTALLVEANPVLGELVLRLLAFEPDVTAVNRVLFWLGMALLVWPLIAPQRMAGPALPVLALPRGPGAASVARGLVVFNAILAVQTGMDAAFLWGGAALPDGMTAAEYAHRGAYPLLATALLAGGFALAARPFAAEDRRLRALLLLWLAQNAALTLSALLRLEVYVKAFGLTYLRAHAAIWMVLVAVGLGLTALQVWRGLPNRWLMVRTVGLGIGTLYACGFVNFAAIIAAQNLSRAEYDARYICGLGPMAAAAVAASGRDMRVPLMMDTGLAQCSWTGPGFDGWRDWGFRTWRVRHYLDGLAEGGHEDPRRG